MYGFKSRRRVLIENIRFSISEFLVVGGFRDMYGCLGVYFIYIFKGDG